MEIIGKYGTAIVYNEYVEQEAISQIYGLLNHPAAENAHIRVMSDVHSGAGCVIGYTARLNSKIIPNLIGVDIGCSVFGYNLGRKHEIHSAYDKLDIFIRKNIPFGSGKVCDAVDDEFLDKIFPFLGTKEYTDWIKFKSELNSVSKVTGQNAEYVYSSIGSLGSGNHFISIEMDNEDNLWLLVHSGSRNFGTRIAEYHQTVAEDSNLLISKEELERQIEEIRKTKKGKNIEYAIQELKRANKKRSSSGLEYLEGDSADAYIHDMKVAQLYSRLNRLAMVYKIVRFYKQNYDTERVVETIHNYINFNDNIIRKGAVSAHAGEMLLIPMNMEYGTLLCRGLGNEEWNYSAPHGAGRLMSRSKAKNTISLEKYQETMRKSGVWSSCVNKGTIDESPQAYKNPDEIIRYIEPTVDIITRLKTQYNFKASD